MSADLMLVDDDHNSEKGSGECVFVDETSMGQPWHEFAILLNGSSFIDDALIERVKHWANVLTVHKGMVLERVVDWLEKHKGGFIRMECW